jgi:hypothetical protein
MDPNAPARAPSGPPRLGPSPVRRPRSAVLLEEPMAALAWRPGRAAPADPGLRIRAGTEREFGTS